MSWGSRLEATVEKRGKSIAPRAVGSIGKPPGFIWIGAYPGEAFGDLLAADFDDRLQTRALPAVLRAVGEAEPGA